MTDEQNEIINELVEKNTESGNLHKAVEELSELTTALAQYIIKDENREARNQEVIDEIGDVEIRLTILKRMFNEEEVNKRVSFKLTKLKSYLDKGLYKGRI